MSNKDPWTEFLKEELIRVQSKGKNEPILTDPEHSSITHVDSDDHDTVRVANMRPKIKQPRTPDTYKESPPSTPPPPPRTILVETNHAPRSGVLSCLGPYKGIIIGAVLIYLVLATGFGGYLLERFLGIPSLNREISQLTEQVNLLQKQNEILKENVQDLTEQVDRQASLNGELASNATLLQSEVNETRVLIQTLNNSLILKESLNNQLQNQIITYQKSLADANNTLSTLQTLNVNLSDQVDSLNLVLDNYTLANLELETQVANLTSSTQTLQDTVTNLRSTIEDLENETQTLTTLNENLGTVVSFLNITWNQNTQAYQELMSSLSNQITVYRGLVSEDLELYYRYFVDNWACDFTSRFGIYPFGVNATVPFGSFYNDVLDRIYTKDLGYLCINRTDFELFLVGNILPPGSTVSDTHLLYLEEAVSQYSAKVLEYYFPTTTSTHGLQIHDWENATWSCENLPTSLRFTMDQYHHAVGMRI